jgi:L-alanine-DL-glutamate epimerase-like enolase superfamily enzyme
MRIRRIAARIMEARMRIPYRTAVASRTRTVTVLVELELDAGVVGIGQAAESARGYAPFEQKASTIKETIENVIAPRVAGMDARDIGKIHEAMKEVCRGHSYAQAAVDVAVHDALGKALQVPVATLLGGALRDELALAAPHLGYMERRELLAEVERYVAQGYRYLNVRAGRDLQEDCANLREIRRLVGDDIVIDVDFSQALGVSGGRPDRAISYLKRLEEYGVGSFEQPLAAWDLEGMARVAKAIDTPLIADESVFTAEDVARVARMGAADGIKIKVVKGGLSEARRMVAVAEAHGMVISVGHGLAASVQNAAEVHLACCVRYLKEPGEMNGFVRVEADVFEGLECRDGKVGLPVRAGLGVAMSTTGAV